MARDGMLEEPPTRNAWLTNARTAAITLALGAVGGAIFYVLTLPLPWMLGAMTIVTIAAIGGVKVQLSNRYRNVMVSILGVLLGSSFTPTVLAGAAHWGWTMLAQAVSGGVMLALGYAYARRVAGHDRPTAYYSAAPGGMVEMSAFGGAAGGDDRAIALNHAIRILIVVFTVPVWFRLQGALAGPSVAKWVGLLDMAPLDLLILAACAVLGGPIGSRLSLPAAAMTGPMVLSAIVHLTGLTETSPPTLLVFAAQIVMGSSVGTRFAGVAPRRVAMAMVHGVPLALLMIATAVAMAAIVAPWVGVSMVQLVLTFAPGGVAEMNLVALALGFEVAFVATHQVVRVLLVVVLAPIVARYVLRAR